MANPTPGSGGVPYTHRELFLAANHFVGKGLDTHAGINNTELQNKSTFKEIVNDFDTLATVRSTEKLWNELVLSEVVKQIAESEFTVEYAAKHAPGVEENTYQDVQDLIEYSNIASADPETIEWLLNIDLTHHAIWSNVNLYNKLLKHNRQWMDYFVNLTSFGNPINWLDGETRMQLALYAVGEYQRDPYAVFSDQAKINKLLKQGNSLTHNVRSAYNIPTNHDGFISGRNNNGNTGYDVRPFSTERWRDSEYTNYRAVGLLDRSLEIRRVIAQGRLGLNDPTFKFTDLFDGVVLDNFWDYDWDYEFIKYARAEENRSSTGDYSRDAIGTSNVDTSTNIKLAATAESEASASDNASNDAGKSKATARLKTQQFDVSNKNSLTVNINRSNSHTQHKKNTDGYFYGNSDGNIVSESKSSVSISVGDDTKQWGGGDTPNDHTFSISNSNTIDIDIRVDSDSDYEMHNNWDLDTAANASVNITSIDID